MSDTSINANKMIDYQANNIDEKYIVNELCPVAWINEKNNKCKCNNQVYSAGFICDGHVFITMICLNTNLCESLYSNIYLKKMLNEWIRYTYKKLPKDIVEIILEYNDYSYEELSELRITIHKVNINSIEKKMIDECHYLEYIKSLKQL